MAKQKTIQELTDEFAALPEQEQRNTLFQLIISSNSNVDKGFNQMGVNQQEMVQFLTQKFKVQGNTDKVIINTLGSMEKQYKRNIITKV